MKRIFLVPILSLFALSLFVSAEGPDVQYVKIYNLIAEGDEFVRVGQPDLARDKYTQAENELRKLQNSYPKWNETVLQFRLEYLAEKLKSSPLPKGAPIVPEKPAPAAGPPAGDDAVRRIQSLTEEVRQLQQDRSVLEAKLKEALSARPAASDPRELAKAEDRIKVLEKEKELFRVSLEQEQAKQAKQTDSALVEELKKALADASKKLSEQTEKAVQLEREKAILEARLQSAHKEAETAKALKTENDELKKRLGEAKPVTEMSVQLSPQKDVAAGSATNRTAEAEVIRLRTELKILRDETATLENAKKDLETKLASVSAARTKSGVSEGERLKQVEKERDDLLKKLNETSRQIYDNKARSDSVRKQEYDTELAILRARLEVFEARKIPYTPEEMALFKGSALTTAKPEAKAGKKPLRELPKGAGPLVADAERAFAARRFDEAEKKYLQLLHLDEKNVFTLANLAACQLEENRLGDAEANLKRALEYEADDSHSLSLLGILRFRQEKFDEALDLLSRAAQLDPQNPETENYLGVTLSQKGQRGPAETALRKAVQLAPGYGGAHHNLAVVYATQQPPFIELARWHYQKALASGHPPNPDLEKLIETSRPAGETK